MLIHPNIFFPIGANTTLSAFTEYTNNTNIHKHNMSLSNKLSITDVDLKGKRVLIRVSICVPKLYNSVY